jgi:predicted aspartyl protease
MYPFTYASRLALNVARNSRAFAEVYVEDPATGRRDGPEACLVDTGADYTVLPVSALTGIGLMVAGLPTVTIRTVDGSTATLPKAAGLHLEIEGVRITTDVLFSSAQKFTPVVGRLDLMKAFDFGFDTSYWHFG